MEKVKVEIKINDYIIKNIGIIDNDILKVKDDETNLEYDYKNNILIRENKEYKIILDFNKKQVIYNIKDIKNKFSNKLVILKLTNYNKQVNINYQIEEEEFSLSIKHETI